MNSCMALPLSLGLLIIALGLMLAPCPAHAAERELVISAAMSLRDAFEDIAGEYEGRNPGIHVVLNFSSSGKLRQQIEAGAPVDVYASASKRHMDMLEKDGRIVIGSRRDFARNTIVLAAPVNSTLTDFDGLLATGVQRIALGNPASSPAGQYAKQTLVALDIWDRVRVKLVFVETVRQVLDYISRDEVDAGLLYATDAALNPDAVSVMATPPEGAHAAISYPIAIVSDSGMKEAAAEFIALVTGPYGQRALAGRGFIIAHE